MIMSNYIKSINVKGLYGRFDLRQEFYPGVNILYGKNGSGKTTLLHILANALNGDYDRFAYLKFDSIKIRLANGVILTIHQSDIPEKFYQFNLSANDKTISTYEYRFQFQNDILEEDIDNLQITPKKFRQLLPPAYFPAYRIMIEAWSSIQVENIDFHWEGGYPYAIPSTDDWLHSAQAIFGKFVPDLNYLSSYEIQFHHFRKLDKKLNSYLEIVNSFFEEKKLAVEDGELKLKFDKENDYHGFQALSSGERQIVTMLYAASQMSDHQLILIDEPELSLHVDWQERLLRQMSEMFGGRQIIVCTHSPMIGAAFEERMMELTLTPTRQDRQDQEKMAA